MRRLILASSLLFCSQAALADAFTECPARAFLTQDTVAKTYGVNLVSGDFGLLQNDMGTSSKVNATGFSPEDRFIYGWGYEKRKPVRIHSDFKVEFLDATNIPDFDFYVGDVATTTNTYYVYKKGKGLFAMSLDSSDPDYLKMMLVPGSEALGLNIFDMAFHPRESFAYAVDKTGNLKKIDVENGTAVDLGNIGYSGTFGAAYFDVDGNLYVASNRDGNVYKVAIDSGSYQGQLFARGPSSSINDGSRCALAPVIDESNTDLDFGDAPASYGTMLGDNGARHGLLADPDLYLGAGVDGESDGKAFPESDDESDRSDDENGIQFASTLQPGEQAIIMVDASKTGVLSAWIDTNKDGVFGEDEQVINKIVSAGKRPVYVTIPEFAETGPTWARFRLSSDSGIGPTGGVSDGEVEDYPVDIHPEATVSTHYPSISGWTTVAYEDNWPFEGDYDMNDLVAHLRTSVFRSEGKVTQIKIEGELAAVGAAYHNGFGVRLPGILSNQIDRDKVNFIVNNRAVSYSPLEWGRQEAIFVITYNTWNYVSAGESCLFYRTEEGCGSDVQMKFSLTIPMKEPIDSDISGLFDPFLFATPGAWHGEHFSSAPGRGYEIHLKNQEPTEAFDYSLMDFSGQDASNPGNQHYFQTTNGLPWAMEMGSEWKYPKEYRDLTHAYPKFPSFVRSEGAEEPAWYLNKNAVQSILFKD